MLAEIGLTLVISCAVEDGVVAKVQFGAAPPVDG